ncbi:hypothetical protein KCU69_g46, partial [Aureobasidium melanogenum]
MQKLEHHAVRTGGCRLTSCHRTSDPRVETMVVMFCPEASPQLYKKRTQETIEGDGIFGAREAEHWSSRHAFCKGNGMGTSTCLKSLTATRTACNQCWFSCRKRSKDFVVLLVTMDVMFGNFSGANAGFDFLVHVKVVMTSLAAWRDSKLEAMLSIEGIGKR